jgi:type I restriction enzyme S subunit
MTLADVCQLIVDCEHKTAPTQATGYPSIRTPNIGRGYFILDGVNRVSEETYQLWTRRAVPQHGDLIMAREAPVGNVAMVPRGLKPCLGQRTLLIRPDPTKVHPRYLTYLLVGDEIQGVIHGLTNGATVPHLNMKDVRSLPLPPLPELSTQRKIAGVLSAYDDLIENNTRRIAILEEMAQAIYREWFVNFRFPGHEKVKLINSPLGKIPEGWERKQLREIANLRLGKMLDAKKNKGELMPYLANVNLRWGEFDLQNLREMRFESDELEAYGLKYGDIVMCEGGEPGRCAIWTERVPNMMIQKAIHRIRSRQEIDFRWLYHALRHKGQSGQLESLFTGATIKHLPREKLDIVIVEVPPKNLMDFFSQSVEPMALQVEVLTKRNEILRKTRDLLLPKLICGQLNVEEIDIDAGEPLVEVAT